MYRIDLSTPKYSNAWDNFVLINSINWSSLDDMLEKINAKDIKGSGSEILFFSEEDALIFIMKYG